ncbi:MAG: phosphate ABC transporter ATP-binding protein PstB [Candidatus Omnitrophica bacterium]|nr:phosphate ABC transporter ATP-binding protein PstB [Candidatus Omnitrophota bacterium]
MVKFRVEDLSVWYGQTAALRQVSMDIPAHRILSIIGPSNSGKTTFLRRLNRLIELEVHCRLAGRVTLDEVDIMNIDRELLRKRVGMVFALPLPLPLSIFDNVAYGVRMHGARSRAKLADIVEKALREAHIWDEVKDRLQVSAFKLSGGQQQRLCIARTLAVEPEVILFDEPCSGLDPISTAKVEETMLRLKQDYTIVLVTNNVKQAARVGDKTAFFLMGELVEFDATDKIFTVPSDRRTDEYISGKFG